MTTVVNPDLEMKIMDISMEWMDKFDGFNMEIDAGLTAIGAALTACCTAKYITPQTYTSTVTNPDGTTTSTSITGPPSNFSGYMSLIAQQGATGAWSSNYQDWLDAYETWQTQQAIIGLGQLIAQVAAIISLMDDLEAFQECANEEQAALKATSEHLRTSFVTACEAYNTHMAEVTPMAPDLTALSMWEADFETANIEYGYDQIQKDHVQNMGTHLAQLCTNARDVNNDLKTCLQYLDGAWIAGGNWSLYEDCLLEDAPDSFTAALKNSTQAQSALADYLSECGQAVSDCFSTGGDSWLAAIKPQLNNLIGCMTDAEGVLADSKTVSTAAMACITQVKENWTQVYDPEESTGGTVDMLLGNANCLFTQAGTQEGTVFNGATFMKDCTDFMQTCAVEKKEIFERYLGVLTDEGSSGEYCLGRVIIDQACGLVNNLQMGVTFLSEHKEDCINHYNETYLDKENTLQVALMNSACDLVACFQAMHTWLDTHGDAMDACWTEGYEGEKAHAATLLAEADLLADTHSDTFDFLCDCAEQFKACYEVYAMKEHVLAITTLDEACDLAPCVQLAHNWLCEQADKQNDRYCEFWVDKENAHVCDLIDKALELSCRNYECLDAWCDNIDDLFNELWECYGEAECATSTKLINAGIPSCEKNEMLYEVICDRSENLWDKFWDEWCPCDSTDLAKHCEMWEKGDYLCEIKDNSDCVQHLGEVMKECYETLILPCEKDYLNCVCEMPKYDPKYCEMESRAVLHVRKQFSMQREEIKRCVSPYCEGALIERLADLADSQVKAEQLSIQVADRWEWLRKVHEDDRRHRYHMDTLQFMHQYVGDSANLYEQSTRGNDLILQRIHERILRGYTYRDSSLQHANSVFTSVQNASANALQGIQLGHFWPDWWTNSRSTYLNNSENRLNTVQNAMTHGLNVARHASEDKAQAARLAVEQQQLGWGAIDRGHNNARMAIDTKVQADMVASRVSSQGLQAAQNGHFYHQQASNDKNAALNAAELAAQHGQRAVDQGHRVKQMALESAMGEWQGAHAGVQDGLASIDRGHWWLENMRADKAQAYSQYMQGWELYQRQLDQGRNTLNAARDWSALASQQLQNQMGHGFDAVQSAIGIWTQANRKVEASMNAQSGNIGRAIDFYNSGLTRQNTLLDAKTQMSGFITTSTDAMGRQAQLGHNLMSQACQASYRHAQLDKQCYEYACDSLRAWANSYGTLSAQVSGSIIGSSNSQAQNTMGMLAGLGNSLFSNLSTIVGPPPDTPPSWTLPAQNFGDTSGGLL